MSWFSELTGIKNETLDSVRKNLAVDGTTLVSKANSRTFEIGSLTTPRLAELRDRKTRQKGTLSVSEVVGNAQSLHMAPENEGAVFQVASQFNLLEMVGPSIPPEAGITGYENDLTQGPACAIACGAGTIYRNYFHPFRGGLGQTSDRQINCLEDIEALLQNKTRRHWHMQNGYVIPLSDDLADLNLILDKATSAEIDILRSKLRVGVQQDTEVTIGKSGHLVTQVYCSAVPVSYSRLRPSSWEGFAQLILDAAYEATLLAAVENAQRTRNNRVYLTLLGGGAFGNREEWIVRAILRALDLFRWYDLEVFLVSYGRSSEAARQIVTGFEL